jgi:hypothetical protein
MFPWNHQISRLNPDMSILALVMEPQQTPVLPGGRSGVGDHHDRDQVELQVTIS